MRKVKTFISENPPEILVSVPANPFPVELAFNVTLRAAEYALKFNVSLPVPPVSVPPIVLVLLRINLSLPPVPFKEPAQFTPALSVNTSAPLSEALVPSIFVILVKLVALTPPDGVTTTIFDPVIPNESTPTLPARMLVPAPPSIPPTIFAVELF